jgi:cysteinyl-tRNA synthetase
LTVRIFNTLSAGVDDIKGRGLNPSHINMYVCGPTVYDSPHVGHGRSYLFFDVLKRVLTLDGYTVSHIQNFSDVDEKIDRRAQAEKMEPLRLAVKYSDQFISQMDMLNVIRPDRYVRASESREIMHKITSSFMQRDLAYEAGGNIYFRAMKSGGYGSLLHARLDDLICGNESDSYTFAKEDKEDFTVWLGKFSKTDISAGLPSWNLECFSMVHKFFGCELDIQGGGMDLIFPHHEVASVMSKAYCKVEFANYYVHNAFVTNNRDKMSKSTNNFVSVHSLLDSYSPEAIRMYLLSSNFRTNIEFSFSSLKKFESLASLLSEAGSRSGAGEGGREVNVEESKHASPRWTKFFEFLRNNVDTADALGVLTETAESRGFYGREGRIDFRLMCAALGLFGYRPVSPDL